MAWFRIINRNVSFSGNESEILQIINNLAILSNIKLKCDLKSEDCLDKMVEIYKKSQIT